MRQSFTHSVKKRLSGILLLCLLPACTGMHTLRLSVPVAEAAIVGRLTQPVRRPAAERTLIAAGRGAVAVGPITRVRVLGSRRAPVTIPLPFFAGEEKGHLVIQGLSGKLQVFPLDRIKYLEVETTVPGSVWRPTDYVLLLGLTFFVVLVTGLVISSMDEDL